MGLYRKEPEHEFTTCLREYQSAASFFSNSLKAEPCGCMSEQKKPDNGDRQKPQITRVPPTKRRCKKGMKKGRGRTDEAEIEMEKAAIRKRRDERGACRKENGCQKVKSLIPSARSFWATTGGLATLTPLMRSASVLPLFGR